MKDTPLNILMITKWYPNREDPQLGVFIQKHAKAISLLDTITVIYAYGISNKKENYQIEYYQHGNLNEVIVYYKKATGSFSLVINGYRYFKSITSAFSFYRKKNQNKKIDIIHSYIFLRSVLIGKYLSFRNKVPLVISEQWSGYATGKFAEYSIMKRWLISWLCKNSKGLSMVSQFLQTKMHSNNLKNSNEAITPNVIEKIVVSEIKTSDTVQVLLVADLVDDIKNISAVIRIVAKVKDVFPNFVLKIIGQGRDKENLLHLSESLNLVNHKVIFEGLKTNEEVYEYLKECDFLVMNSRFETFSLICVEAMSCGKPVLATRCGGPESFVTEANGILIPVDDDQELMNQFIYMLKNYSSFNRLEIRSSVEKQFSPQTVATVFHQFYLDAI